jgi:hypothetical protein
VENKKKFCKNCETELFGEFCSSCGQRDKDLHVPVKELASELFEVIPSFDERLIRSIKPFLFKPGFLALEYLSGKRKRYISPFKFYFFISFLFFFISAINFSGAKKNFRNDVPQADSMQTVINRDSLNITIRSSDSNVNFTLSDTSRIKKLFGKKFIEGFKSGKNNPQMFFDKIKEHLPKIIFLLLPVFALSLKLIYVRSKILYIQHLIFSFYFHSFIFFILFIDILLEITLPKSLTEYGDTVLFLIPVYLYFGLKNVYGQTGWKTLIKLFLLSLSHVVVFILTLILLVIATIFLFFT